MGGCGPKEKGWYVGNPIGGRFSGIWGYGRRGGNDLRLGRPLMPLSPPPLLGGLGSRVELTELVFEGAVSLWRGFIVRDPRNERSVSLSASCRSYTSLYNSLSLLKKQIKNTTTHKKNLVIIEDHCFTIRTDIQFKVSHFVRMFRENLEKQTR